MEKDQSKPTASRKQKTTDERSEDRFVGEHGCKLRWRKKAGIERSWKEGAYAWEHESARVGGAI